MSRVCVYRVVPFLSPRPVCTAAESQALGSLIIIIFSLFFPFGCLAGWLAAAILPYAGQRADFRGCRPQRSYTPTRPVSQAAPPAVSLLRWFAWSVPWETKKGAAAQQPLDKREARLQGDHSGDRV